MTVRPRPATTSLDAIARPNGTLAMVAMDQRESLRTMFAAAGPGRPADEVLVRFKLDVAEALGSLASGFLIDRHFGFDRVRTTLPASTGLILAADALTQADGGPVVETALDEVVFGPDFDLDGVAAVKLLIIWRRDELREQRVHLAADFIARAAERGLLSVLEPVVRATAAEVAEGGTNGAGWNADAAIREAARELSALGPTLYKVQVPLAGAGTPVEQATASEELARSITGPWVVLSQGVALGDFLTSVEAACRAGASGFLAGRALWSDIVGNPDVPAALRFLAVPRLQALIETVDREARPWGQA
jgi:sulfofructosephosphate aldolase